MPSLVTSCQSHSLFGQHVGACGREHSILQTSWGNFPTLQLRCSLGQRWTHQILKSGDHRSRFWREQMWSNTTCSEMLLSGRSIWGDGLLSKTIQFICNVSFHCWWFHAECPTFLVILKQNAIAVLYFRHFIIARHCTKDSYETSLLINVCLCTVQCVAFFQVLIVVVCIKFLMNILITVWHREKITKVGLKLSHFLLIKVMSTDDNNFCMLKSV